MSRFFYWLTRNPKTIAVAVAEREKSGDPYSGTGAGSNGTCDQINERTANMDAPKGVSKPDPLKGCSIKEMFPA